MTKIFAVPPLPDDEAEIVAGLDSSFLSYALEVRRQVLAAGIPFRFTSGLRSYNYQKMLYDNPDLHPGTPAAAPGTSKHEVGFAADAEGPRDAGEWATFGGIVEGLGLIWGGRFSPKPDTVHFEAATPRAELAIYRNVKIAAGVAGAGTLFWLGIASTKG